MIPTVTALRQRVVALVDDPLQQIYTDSVILEGYGEAIDALQDAFVRHQIQKAKAIVTYTLPANTTSLTPATAGILDFGELIHMEERAYGSTDKYTPVWQSDDLPQRDATDRLLNFEWRGDAWYFVGATTQRQLRIAYFCTAEQPTSMTTGYIPADGALTFLAKYTAGIIAPRKGDIEMGQKYMMEAVGPKYHLGIDGGELLRLITPMIRSRQQVPLAVRPFSANRRMGMRRWIPYVASQPGQSGVANQPTQFSSALGTITGTINGVNLVFYLPYALTTISNLSVNGVAKTRDVHYAFAANTITFTAGNAPATGPITCDGWL